MPRNTWKPRGQLKKNKPGAGIAAVNETAMLCTVMSNIDPTNAGRLEVFPSDSFKQDATGSDSWITVNRLSSFFGHVEGQADNNGTGTYTSNPSAYGQWNSPPDIGSEVLVVFVNGDPNYGFYLGMVARPEYMNMVPAIGSTDNIVPNAGEAQSYGGATVLPVTSMNTNDKNAADGDDYLNQPKPVHSYTAAIMQQQGVLRDRIRGPISSSATRESISRVGWGVSSPGRPIYSGGFTDEDIASNLNTEKPETLQVVARRGGHSIVMDDGDIVGRDQLIRLRTALGHQILMSDDGQVLMILHSNGQSYIELGKEGTVDIYGSNSINLRTQGDLNLHADNNLNLHGKEISINATENLKLNSEKETTQRAGTDYKLYSLASVLIKADKSVALESTAAASIKSSAETFVEGSKVNLNSGSSPVAPDVVEPPTLIAHPETLFDKQTGWSAAPGKLLSITTRAPAHAPWLAAGQGVDVEIDLDADNALPASPSTTLAATNEIGGEVGSAGVSNASAASIPEVPNSSNAIDKNTTTAILASIAIDTATNPALANAENAANPLSTGSAIIGGAGTDQPREILVGAFGQSPSQLVQGGVLKPGADTMVKTLISDTTALRSAQKSLPTSAFTGKFGASSFDKLVASNTAQAQSVTTNLQKSQTLLTQSGVITGKEASNSLSGVVNAGQSGGNTLRDAISNTMFIMQESQRNA
tara:strand:+ start:15832 stop:17937 length:2106 start_codon:yes stop_codon:yes gene_type:complete